MSRKPRQHLVGDVHHVMSHSIDNIELFDTREDHLTFMNILDEHLSKHDCLCFGFALMSNHYHLILRPSGEDFSDMMRNINSAYARYVNKTRERRGYVFRDRFKSIPTRNLDYIKKLILYVHANPLRAGKVKNIKELERDKFNSHRYLLKGKSPYSWLDVDYMTAVVSDPDAPLLHGYLKEVQSFRSAGFCDPWQQIENRDAPIPRVLSTLYTKQAKWIKEITAKSDERKKRRAELRKIPNVLQLLMEASCKKFCIDTTQFLGVKRTKERNSALSLFSFWAITVCGYSGSVIGRMLGLDSSTVLRAAKRGSLLAETVAFPIAL